MQRVGHRSRDVSELASWLAASINRGQMRRELANPAED